MSTSKGHLKDARGVDIKAGDIVIYGFGVSRSVAMAEGRVESDPKDPSGVSQTPSGMVRVRVVRRSYSQGSKPVISIMADRMVVLKGAPSHDDGLSLVHVLPPSPLPTQDEHLYDQLTSTMERWLEDIERLAHGGDLDEHERGNGYDKPLSDPQDPDRVAYWLGNYREWEARDRKQLEQVCARLGVAVPV